MRKIDLFLPILKLKKKRSFVPSKPITVKKGSNFNIGGKFVGILYLSYIERLIKKRKFKAKISRKLIAILQSSWEL